MSDLADRIRETWEAEQVDDDLLPITRPQEPPADPRVIVYAGRGSNGEVVYILRDGTGREISREPRSRPYGW